VDWEYCSVERQTEFDEVSAVDHFWNARSAGEYFPQDWKGRLSVEQAYRIQLGIIRKRIATGERQVGWKVGLTATAIQGQFNFYEPVFGCLMQEGLRNSGYVFRHDELIKPGFETEICVRLREPLSGTIDVAQVRRAVESCFPALEIIETRGDALAQMALCLADNAQQKAFVLGDPVSLPRDQQLSAVEARVDINQTEVARGRGDAVLGDPLNSIIWLAGKLTEFDLTLNSGDLVMTGSLVRQFPLSPGDRVRAEFSNVGVVEAGVAL
jgi:2-keto-4-pentenoate hydratase